jgi:hypothetical protein
MTSNHDLLHPSPTIMRVATPGSAVSRPVESAYASTAAFVICPVEATTKPAIIPG